MRKKFTYLSLFVLLTACVAGCLDPLGFLDPDEGKPVTLRLDFDTAPAMDVTVLTKSAHTIQDESRVWNLYIMIFDANGKKIYSHFFDEGDIGREDLPEYWTVDNTTYTGSIVLHTIQQSSCTVVGISNINAEMVNVSPELLGTVGSLDELEAMEATLNQLVVSRSGYFPMSGKVSGVKISLVGSGPNAVITKEGATLRLPLRRLDAKVEFKIRVADNSPIASFTPTSWEVVNLPKKGYVIERAGGENKDAARTGDDFFSYLSSNFEPALETSGGTQKEVYGVSFYMLENRRPPRRTTGVTNFMDREEQDNEMQNVQRQQFKTADSLSAYMVLKGRVKMDNVHYHPSDEDPMAGTTLSAEVRYVIHLGDFSGNQWTNFDVERNRLYTYNIKIYDVRDIRVEVEQGDENEPAAEGKVVVAKEEIWVTDAHYGSHVMQFHARNIDADDVSWFVETPFHKDGIAPLSLDMTAGIDFGWVLFRVNEMEVDEETGQKMYKEGRQLYRPLDYEWPEEMPESQRTMNVNDLVKYLKKQKRLYGDAEDGTQRDPLCEFDDDPEGPKINVTAFVDEFYYESNPVTGEIDHDLWKSFVNQPVRQMHILSDTKYSPDRKSREIGSSFTIQQRAIQTIYNTQHPSLSSAWGVEFTDEGTDITHYSYSGYGDSDRGNNSPANGRSNSFKEWEFEAHTEYVTGTPHTHMYHKTAGPRWAAGDVALWDHYLNLEAENTNLDDPRKVTNEMHQDLKYLRFTCLSRNRDNDGDDIIDQDELRWYMGATNQLIGLFLGSYGIEGDGRLYQRTPLERADTRDLVWREHVVSSTRWDDSEANGKGSNTVFRVIWAEEGLTGSIDTKSIQFSDVGEYSTRCVRNLGMYVENGEEKDITYADPEIEPENYIQVTRCKGRNSDDTPVPDATSAYSPEIYFVFDCSRLNTASLRYYTQRELILHHEDNEEACLYKKFETAPVRECPTFSSLWMEELNENVTNSPSNPYCPKGYRLPNIRELAVYRYFIESPSDMKSVFKGIFAFSRTYWSFGTNGPNYKNIGKNKNKKYFGWCATNQKMVMAQAPDGNGANQNTTSVRCVRDMKY